MTLEEVKQIPMREVVERYGLMPSRSGFIRCPFHNEKSGSMKIYARDAHCFGCGWNGDQLDFVRQMDNLSFKEAFMLLGGTYEDEDREDIRQKARQAEIRRRENAEREAAARAERDANNRYISILRNGLDCFPVYSDEWCFCQNELTYRLHVHDELNEMRAKK